MLKNFYGRIYYDLDQWGERKTIKIAEDIVAIVVLQDLKVLLKVEITKTQLGSVGLWSSDQIFPWLSLGRW